jgi:hypothetical protein
MNTTKFITILIFLTSITACQSLTKKTNTTSSKTSNEEQIPKIIKPNVKKIWIPDEIRNNGTEYIEGHFMYVIQKGSSWSK